MEKVNEMLLAFIDAEMKKSVFAAFSNLRFVDAEKPHSFDDVVKGIRRNDLFVAAKAAGVNMADFKKVLIDSTKKAMEELIEKLSKAYDYAADENFIPEKKEEKK